jgi:hypothetical protein
MKPIWFVTILITVVPGGSNSFASVSSAETSPSVEAPRATDTRWVNMSHPDHCRSADEFTDTVVYLRGQRVAPLLEKEIVRISEEVANGCNGASQRFRQVFAMLIKTGVDVKKSVQTGIAFAKESPETVKGFTEIFQKSYLENYLNLDYVTALEVSYELSRDFPGNVSLAYSDFVNITKFCLDPKRLGLPVKSCARIAIDVARLSCYYPLGVYQPFEELYGLLRNDASFGISIREALKIATEVMHYGPKASENFIKTFRFSVSRTGLDQTANNSLRLALRIAKKSNRYGEPPLYPKDLN